MPLKELCAARLLDALPDAAVILDRKGKILDANSSFVSMLGRERPEVLGEEITGFLVDKSVFDSCIRQVGDRGECRDQMTRFRHRDGRTVRTVKNVRTIEHGGRPMVLALIRDLTSVDDLNRKLQHAENAARRDADALSKLIDRKERELSSTRTQLEEILNAIDEIIWYIDDATMQVRYVSRSVEPVFGISQRTFVDDPTLWQHMVYAEDRPKVLDFFRNLAEGDSKAVEFRIERTDGRIRWLDSRISHHPELNLFIGITRDITESKSAKDLVEFLAYHDPLTRLPNRIALRTSIEEMIGREAPGGSRFALLFLDLDNFKYINDARGHEIGDEILVKISASMQRAVPGNAQVTRFGGDEFIILLGSVRNRDEIDRCAQTLLHCFADPFVIEDEQFFLSASIGISLFPDHADNPSDLIKHADTAMYAAKHAGKNRRRYYDTGMEEPLRTFFHVDQLIREGIKHDYFYLEFQPFVDARSHSLTGFEALLRFRHPDGETLRPDRFIPVAERTGDILKLSELVFRESCRFTKRLLELTGSWLPVSVNLSARQFQDNQLLATLKQCLQAQGIPAHALSLEVTESVIMKDIETVRSQLETLRRSGFTIALDDFGTGYSSLEYLAKLPIDTLKIDKSFVRSLFESRQNEHLVKAITNMAKAMGMKVTAEGVEDPRQADFLLINGVHNLQGYLFSPALPAEEIVRRIESKAPYFTPGAPIEFSI